MKIALVIPTYKPHYIYLQGVCRNAAEQTRIPDLVVIRASSCDEEAKPLLDNLHKTAWPFPLLVLETAAQQYQAQNRNEGADAVPPEFDIISFFDSDDLMHPRRLELVERPFNQGAEAVLHSRQNHLRWDSFLAPPHHVWDSILLQKESAIQAGNQIISRSEWVKQFSTPPIGKEITFFRPIPMDEELEEDITMTYGHISVTRKLFQEIRFDKEALGYEDAKFLSEIVAQRRRTASIRASLSFYSTGSGLSVSTITSSGSGYSE
jgi:hypothetical protein